MLHTSIFYFFFFFIKEPSFCLTLRHVLEDTSQMNKAYVWPVIRSPHFMIGCTWPSWLFYPSFFTGFSLIIPTEIKQQSEFSLFLHPRVINRCFEVENCFYEG